MPAAAPSPALFFGVSKEGIGHNFHFQFFQTTRLVRTAKKKGLKKCAHNHELWRRAERRDASREVLGRVPSVPLLGRVRTVDYVKRRFCDEESQSRLIGDTK
jgi:hypothetical protein